MKRSAVEHTNDQETFQSETKKKKKKAKEGKYLSLSATEDADLVTSAEKEVKGRHYTVSIALPGSIIQNAQSKELKTYLAGQIARAACVFCVDEIVVFDETVAKETENLKSQNPNLFLVRILEYLETPQYLRKLLFPIHKDLQFAGLLNPLDCPHHMRQEDQAPYREGVVLDRPPNTKKGRGSYVNVGTKQDVCIDKTLKPGVRVTVKIDSTHKEGSKRCHGAVVSPRTPARELGLYWGYTVRLANSFGAVFTESPYKSGYDLTVGTSERGSPINEVSQLPPFKHLLIVFGGLQGLEASLESDESLAEGDVSKLFNLYLNTCPDQGSRTIRTEEAILISLSALDCHIRSAGYKE